MDTKTSWLAFIINIAASILGGCAVGERLGWFDGVTAGLVIYAFIPCRRVP